MLIKSVMSSVLIDTFFFIFLYSFIVYSILGGGERKSILRVLSNIILYLFLHNAVMKATGKFPPEVLEKYVNKDIQELM